jgi:hypothetical protein
VTGRGYFLVVVVPLVVEVAFVVDVAGLVVVVPLFRLDVVVVVVFLPSLPPHDAAKSGNSTSATTTRPYTNRGTLAWSCRMSRLSVTAYLHLGRFGHGTERADAVADLLTIQGNGAVAVGMRCALGRE